jgi:tetratricopeptide (TPR) repeat protein
LSLKPALSEVARYLERLRQESFRGGGIRFDNFVAQREIIKKGEKLLREGLIKEASEIFIAVLQIDPEDFEALCDMGVIYFYTQDYEKAYDWFIKSLKIAPTVQDTLVNLFDTALRIKKVAEIVPVLRQAVQMRPELSDVSSVLAQIDSKGEAIYSIENFDSIDESEEKYRKGIAFLESVELNQATLCFLDVVDKKPYNDRAFNALGIIAFYRKNYSDAFALFHHAVKLNPLNTDAVLNLFDASKKLSREEEVRPYLENISQIDMNPAIQNALQEIN